MLVKFDIFPHFIYKLVGVLFNMMILVQCTTYSVTLIIATMSYNHPWFWVLSLYFEHFHVQYNKRFRPLTVTPNMWKITQQFTLGKISFLTCQTLKCLQSNLRCMLYNEFEVVFPMVP